MAAEVFPAVSGERFAATYRIGGDAARARAVAEAICLEQTVEFPRALLPPGGIERDVVGRLEALEPDGDGAFRARVAFPVEDTGFELPQLLNVVWGNVSLFPGVRLVDLALSPALVAAFPGPRLGRQGLRARLGARGRPLLCTALKPMGLPAQALADFAGAFARGGIDLVKDDHGLANQPFAPWRERAARCAQAVADANAATGGRCVYLPNVTAPAGEVRERAHAARALGAGGLLVSPGLTGFDAMRDLAADPDLDLPVMAHPAFLGSYITSEGTGIALGVLFGTIMRLGGADAVIFPNHGGRFALTPAECGEIAAGTGEAAGGLRPAFPVPGGGMTLDRVAEMRSFYGDDVVLLIGGGLFEGGDPLRGAQRFAAAVGA